jgi:phospholipase C
MQENRSFDSTFGKLGSYKQRNGFGSAGDVDDLDRIVGGASNVSEDGTVVASFKMKSVCFENISPDWLESWGDINFNQPGLRDGSGAAIFNGDGYVHNGQGFARYAGEIALSSGSSGSIDVTPNPSNPSLLSPFETTNYYLFYDNGTKLITEPLAVVQAIVTDPNSRVKNPSKPQITPPVGVTFTVAPVATPSAESSTVTVNPGEKVRIKWNVPGAAQVRISTWYDLKGRRAMGYYDQDTLPYHYFMAANFATSDRFFGPMPGGSEPNRAYFFAATTRGRARDPGGLDSNTTKNIFQLLEEKGISWRIYYHELDPTNGKPATRLQRYEPFFTDILTNKPERLARVEQYFTDIANNTLPQVVFIEELSGLDEHPGGTLQGDIHSGNSIQAGAQYASNLINGLMNSALWKDSAFFLIYDEAGGLYDHVAPMGAVGQVKAVHPDGIAPTDILPKDSVIRPAGNFDVSGLRIPMIVISPFARKQYVSHTSMDYTAILKFIEVRFKLPSLTNRDAAQPDMQEFFDFPAAPWSTPPAPPAQPLTMPCDYTNL